MNANGAHGRIWDISQTLRPDLPVWPGDTQFTVEPSWAMDKGSPVNVSRIVTSSHAGTHGDAPLHYAAGGADAATLALEPYLGPCRVIDMRAVTGQIDVADLPSLEGAKRVLFRSWDAFPHNGWRSDWLPLSPQAVGWLALQGVVLIGTDAPSLDPQDSKTMEAHQAVCQHDLRILEGLVLDEVPEGVYELIALPLKIAGGDAGLCRAILRELS